MELTYTGSTKELGKELASLQLELIKYQIPVVILVDGWENSGKGDVINKLTRELDPRYYSVAVFDEAESNDPKYHFMHRFCQHLPKRGHITIYDRSPYFKAFDHLHTSLREMTVLLEDIYNFLHMLADDGYIVIKLFLEMSHKEQEQRIQKLETLPFKKIFLNKRDYDQLEHYKEYKEHFDYIINRTNKLYSPWRVIPTNNLKEGSRLAMLAVYHILKEKIKALTDPDVLEKQKVALTRTAPIFPTIIPNNLFLPMDEEYYEDEIRYLQEEANYLSFALYVCKIPTICAFEGQDAAGKGGTIKRLTKAIDPRGYSIHQTAAPTKEELSYHYMRRFMVNTPSNGRMAIFDRTWYGRVLVERVEGFATDREWQRAYQEINAIELHWVHSGINYFKFFLAISKEEQLRRFEDRANTASKQFKITDEDWRNRDKWDAYEEAFQEMFYRTSTNIAPWHIVEGDNKLYARIHVLQIFVGQSKRRLKDFAAEHPNALDWKEFWKEYEALRPKKKA